MNSRRRSGFTLVEVMIVVVIMAILAATVIPQFTSSTDEAMDSTALFNLHTLRSQVQLYKVEHRGVLPTSGMAELTQKTDVSGTVDAAGAYGPYLDALPANPFNGKNDVMDVTGTTFTADKTTGWVYSTDEGKVWLNWPGYETK